MDTSAFDSYAAEYDAALEQGISISGEGKDYFARGRIVWLQKVLSASGYQPKSVLDFGCGTGAAVPYFRDILRAESVVGVDVSTKSLDVARKTHGGERTNFLSLAEYHPEASIDLAFCNGVFHHIPLKDRLEAVSYVWKALRPGGVFAFWENNPWNPGTRFVMSRIPFDRDAIMVSPLAARSLLRTAGFKMMRTDFQFIFPRRLSLLRWLEPVFSRMPFGAQYQVLCRK